MELAEMARIFERLGCKAAYNLDGGATAVMMFHQEKYSKPSNGGRDLGDILMITESGYTKNPKTEEEAQ
jgi:exopolysaccharide biosynthesis protein